MHDDRPGRRQLRRAHLAPWNGFNTLSYRVNNTQEGGDWAQISLCVENDANTWAQHC